MRHLRASPVSPNDILPKTLGTVKSSDVRKKEIKLQGQAYAHYTATGVAAATPSMPSLLRLWTGPSDGSSSSTTTIGDDGPVSASTCSSEPPDGEGVGSSASIGGGAFRGGSGVVVNNAVPGCDLSCFSVCALGAEPRERFTRPRPRARPSVLMRSLRNRTMCPCRISSAFCAPRASSSRSCSGVR